MEKAFAKTEELSPPPQTLSRSPSRTRIPSRSPPNAVEDTLQTPSRTRMPSRSPKRMSPPVEDKDAEEASPADDNSPTIKKSKKRKKKAGGAQSLASKHHVTVCSEDGKTLVFDDWATAVLGREKSSSSTGASTTPADPPRPVTEGPNPDPRFAHYKFSGQLRPYPVTPQMKFPEHIKKPDYATDLKGRCKSEEEYPDSKIPIISDEQDLADVREVNRLGREIMDIAASYVHAGVTGDQIDKLTAQACLDRGVYPSPLNYYKFPKSLCISVNEIICHGIPDCRPLECGDICNLDISVYMVSAKTGKGWHSDLNETYFVGAGSGPMESRSAAVEEGTAGEVLLSAEGGAASKNDSAEGSTPADVSSTAAAGLRGPSSAAGAGTASTAAEKKALILARAKTTKNKSSSSGAAASLELGEQSSSESPDETLVRTAYQALLTASKMIKPGTLYRSLGAAIQKVAEQNKCSVVVNYCGHGVGELFHGPPQIPHYKGSKTPGLMKPGHVFTIEPMINFGVGNGGDAMWPDNWTAPTEDGAKSAQFEHTFLVTETGVEVLTARGLKKGGPPVVAMPEWEDVKEGLKR